MAKGYGPLEVPSWAIGVVFTFFLIVTLVWDRMLHTLERWLLKRNKPALTKVLHALKDEVLAVGMIVLLLPLFENHLMEICIPKEWSDNAPGYNPTGWDLAPADPVVTYSPAAAAPEALTAPLPPPPTAADNDATPDVATPAGRRKLSGDAENRDVKQQQEVKEERSPAVCAAGWTQLFPLEAIHGIHIFIALTALVHIFYACVCMLLCMLRMRWWHSWELEAQHTPLFSITSRVIKSVGKTRLSHSVLALSNTFFLPVTKRMYLALRRLFMEGLKQQGQLDHLPQNFPYFDYVQESMQYSFCDVVSVSFLVWFFAIVQLIIPVDKRIWCSVAISSVTILLMVAAGGKLYSIVVNLAARSYFMYQQEEVQGEDDLMSHQGGLHHGDGLCNQGLCNEHYLGSGMTNLSEDHPEAPVDGGKTADVKISIIHPSPPALEQQETAGTAHQVIQMSRMHSITGSQRPTTAAAAAAAGAHPKQHQQEPHTNLHDGGQSVQSETNASAVVPAAAAAAAVMPSSPFAQQYETYLARSTEDDISSMFWFHRPKLLLLFFKVAYFQSAFCLTLVLFALWRSNQFLPSPSVNAELITFFVLLVVNVSLSFFMSTCVLPVYAIVSVTDPGAFAAAVEFADQAERHRELELVKQQSRQLQQQQPQQQQQQQQGSAGDSGKQQQHGQAMLILQKLHSHVGRMQDLAAAAQDTAAVTDPARPDHMINIDQRSPSAGSDHTINSDQRSQIRSASAGLDHTINHSDQRSQIRSASAGSDLIYLDPASRSSSGGPSLSAWGACSLRGSRSGSFRGSRAESLEGFRRGAELWGTVRSHVSQGRL